MCGRKNNGIMPGGRWLGPGIRGAGGCLGEGNAMVGNCVRILAACAGAVLLSACTEQPEAVPADNGAFNFETWDQYLGGADSSQYSSLAQIDKSNVARLEVAWTYPTGENYLFNPIVVDGVMYVLAKNRSIIALDAATGREIWVHANEGFVGTRGMNYWASEDRADRRLFYINAGYLTAIDAGTGETIATFGDNGRVDLRVGLDGDTSAVRALQTNNPGRIFEDLIIMSLPAGGVALCFLTRRYPCLQRAHGCAHVDLPYGAARRRS